MSKIYVPPGLPAKKYLNMATINGIDVGTGSIVYQEGSPVSQRTFKNDIWQVDYSDALKIEDAVEFSGVGSKMSFAVNQATVLFFEIAFTFNPPNSTLKWVYSANQSLNLYLINSTTNLGIFGETFKYDTANNFTVGPFYSQAVATINVGQTDFYLLAGTNLPNSKHVAFRVNVIGWAS